MYRFWSVVNETLHITLEIKLGLTSDKMKAATVTIIGCDLAERHCDLNVAWSKTP